MNYDYKTVKAYPDEEGLRIALERWRKYGYVLHDHKTVTVNCHSSTAKYFTEDEVKNERKFIKLRKDIAGYDYGEITLKRPTDIANYAKIVETEREVDGLLRQRQAVADEERELEKKLLKFSASKFGCLFMFFLIPGLLYYYSARKKSENFRSSPAVAPIMAKYMAIDEQIAKLERQL
ncbi:MAG: hypothetical protein FWD49_00120 [Firmicutes bacterium]|nr:hypothetical protein [Bacillota bacterium]